LDEISYASQMGRLDTISLLLAVFALVLGLGAVAGFMHIKETSYAIAREEAKNFLVNNIIKDDRDKSKKAKNKRVSNQKPSAISYGATYTYKE